MADFEFADIDFAVPDRIRLAHRQAWQRLAGPGSWWTGAERIAIAAAVRVAETCALCMARKQSLSAAAVAGEHDQTGHLPTSAVEAVHRIVTDSSRLSRAWLEGLLASGLSDAAYVEIVGVLTQVLSIDDLHRGLGATLEPLPDPRAGEPARRRPSGARDEGAWVPTVPPDALDPEDADLYGGGSRAANVIRALSLVPNEVRALGELHAAHYLSLGQMREMGRPRVLDRPQLELVAARVSAVNECFY